MKMKTLNLNKFALLALVVVATLFAPACKSKKKVTDTVKKETKDMTASAANVGLVKNQLRQLLTDSNMSVEDLEKKLADLKAKNIADDEVKGLIKQVVLRKNCIPFEI